MSQDQSIARYEGYLKLDPNNMHLLITLGDLYHQAGRFDEALTCYDNCLVQDPSHATAESRKASVFLSQSRFAEAEALLRRLTEGAQPSAVLVHNLALALYYQERWPEAMAKFEQARQGGFADTNNTLYLAYAMHQLGHLAQAAAVCKEALAASPNDTLEGYLCVLEMDEGEIQGAFSRAQTVLERSPDNADAALVAGMWRMDQQEIDDSEQYVDVVLRREPKSARGLLGKGLIHLYRQELAAAIAALEAARQRMPEHLGTIVTLGWAHFAAKDLTNAERVFREAIAVDGTFAESHGGLSVVLVFRNRREEARREAQIARRLNPDGLGAVWAQGALMAMNGKREAGEALVAAALQRPITAEGKSMMDHLQNFSRQQVARSRKLH